MKKIFSYFLAACLAVTSLVFISGCGEKAASIEEALVLNYTDVMDRASEGDVTLDQYNENYCIVSGKIDSIEEDFFMMYLSTYPLEVMISSNDLKDFVVDDTVVVLGKASGLGLADAKIENARILSAEEVDNELIWGLESISGTIRNNTYSDYVLDDKGQIVEYTASRGSLYSGISLLAGDEGRHSLTYDETGKLIRDEGVNGQYTCTFTFAYNDDGDLSVKTEESSRGTLTFENEYVKDAEGNIVHKKVTNTASDYVIEYDYQYEDNKMVREIEHGSKEDYVMDYEYDNYGNYSSCTLNDGGVNRMEYYQYAIIGKK